jgi:hypothetical protein
MAGLQQGDLVLSVENDASFAFMPERVALRQLRAASGKAQDRKLSISVSRPQFGANANSLSASESPIKQPVAVGEFSGTGTFESGPQGLAAAARLLHI